MSSSQLGYEKTDISVGKVFFFSAIPAVLVVVSMIGVHYYLIAAQFKISLTQNKADTTEIDSIRNASQKHLTGFQKKTDGTYIIPIERALSIYAEK